ncbi:hypothetical protein BDP27DRAFT_1432994 [Rhodocollybia butyracea]|uniref:NAD-dependent epimerase/dehydratase domain-containing protein n=1 Tax=Rhodocollybia butyracea TaxID=206335 RepID=A0A9P5P4X4_9AGAR|nr:hypothetical protein BDP27DRAFT_1432994 [Rhodocollybia butyracea]
MRCTVWMALCLEGWTMEDNFDFGLKANVDSVRELFQATRKYGSQLKHPVKFIFTSSCTAYGGPYASPNVCFTPNGGPKTSQPHITTRENVITPKGLGQLTSEICFVLGTPAAASSSFMPGIIHEPLKGVPATCPVGTHLSSPELDLPVRFSSPENIGHNIIYAKHIALLS